MSAVQPLRALLREKRSIAKLGDKIKPWKEVPKFLVVESVSRPYKVEIDSSLPSVTVHQMSGKLIRLTSCLSHWTETKETHTAKTSLDTTTDAKNGKNIPKNGEKDACEDDESKGLHICKTDFDFNSVSFATVNAMNKELEITLPCQGCCYLIMGQVYSPNGFFAYNNFVQSDIVSLIGIDCFDYANKSAIMSLTSTATHSTQQTVAKQNNVSGSAAFSLFGDCNNGGVSGFNGEIDGFGEFSEFNEVTRYESDDIAVMSYVALFSMKSGSKWSDVNAAMNILELINREKLDLQSLSKLHYTLSLDEFSLFVKNNLKFINKTFNVNEEDSLRIFADWKLFQKEFETNEIESWFAK